MKGYTPNPTIRILMLGAEGVGKNCIESRFTTKLYPPPYNPALTLNSRRFFTLTRYHDDAGAEAYHGGHHVEDTHLPEEEKEQITFSLTGKTEKTGEASASERPPTAASISPSSHGTPNSPDSLSTPSLDLDEQTLVNSEGDCSECVRENNTYLIEVINYPSLHKSARVRKQVHSKADYDAVLLVYDVCNRDSFDAITTLHAEIPVCTRKNHYSHHRRAAHHASTTRSRTTGWFGGGGNDLTGHTGSGEIVVGLVGNKSDVDERHRPTTAEDPKPIIKASTSAGHEAISHSSLLSPLYHESIMYEELMAGIERQRMAVLPESPKKTVTPVEPRDSIHQGQELDEALKEEDIQKWLQISRPEPHLGSDKGLKSHQTDVDEGSSSSKSDEKRLVSTVEGEALSRRLNLAVPFQETSAKTGDNVETVFENVVREVLREMGRDASGTNKAGKTCRHKANLGKVKSRDSQVSVERSLFSGSDDHRQSRPLPPSVSKSTVIRIVTAGEEGREQRPESATMFGKADDTVSSAPGVAIETVVSGGSKMGRVRKIFMRRGQNIAV